MYRHANPQPITQFPKVPLKNLYENLCSKNNEFRLYFPDYDKDYCPQRKYFWIMFMSLFKEESDKVLEEHRLKKMGELNAENTTISILPQFVSLLKKYPNKPGKLL